MGDLIDRQAALKEVREAYENDEMFDGYEYRLNELPSTEIILCRECKYGEIVDDGNMCCCSCYPGKPDFNFSTHFCGHAERREESNGPS